MQENSFDNDDQSSDTRKKRRPRSSAGERNYFCGCGKAYLSYPALYTHVKNKHDGIFPIGSNAKRKIPRQADDESECLFKRDINGFYSDFKYYLSQIEEADSKELQTLSQEKLMKYFDDLLKNVQNKEYKNFVDELKKYMIQMYDYNNDREKFQKEQQDFNIYQILSYYLISIYPYCSEQFFQEYFLLGYMLIIGLNEKGYKFQKKQLDKKEIIEEIKFSEKKEIYVIAEIMNLFLAELFPNYLNQYKQEQNFNFIYLGFDDDNIKNLILMTKFLANWLFNFNFLNYRLEINVDF